MAGKTMAKCKALTGSAMKGLTFVQTPTTSQLCLLHKAKN